MSVKVLRDIREELRELRLLYKGLVERLIPVEEPSEEERKAIEEKDEIADEKQLMEALGNTNVQH
jgi:hypothetical protein